MATLADRVFDFGLNVLDTEANRVDICSQEPTTYTEATSTYTLGNATSITISSPADGTPSGRKVVLSAITAASVTGTGTATHYAIVDTVNSRLLATGALATSQGTTSGGTWDLGEVTITLTDPA